MLDLRPSDYTTLLMSTMAEGTYEYECMRAELLGIGKPDYEEFLKNQQERAAAAQEEHDTEILKEAEDEDEQMKHVSGGLDELTSILKVTQRKINKFRASCSSLTSLLKFKLGQGPSSEPVEQNGVKHDTADVQNEEVSGSEPVSANGDFSDEAPRKSDLAKALDNHVDRLDTMIDKAENAHYSMSAQNKELKKMLK